MLQFGQPAVLYGLAAAACLLPAFAWWSGRRSRELLKHFAGTALSSRLAASLSRPRQRLKSGLAILACLCLVLAGARPQWGSITEDLELQGVDILLALDTSRSMLAEDYQPNRLEQARLAILDLVSQLEGDRIGLIAFAGDAFLQVPLTLDYGAFLQTLGALDTETIPRGGTDIAGAIDEAMAYFARTDHHRVLILISDGEDLEARGIQRAREAATEGIAIFTVGVGSPDGELIPLRGNDGAVDFLRDPGGTPVRTRLDEESLQAIAEAGGGIYRRLGRGAGALDEIYSAARATVDEATMGALTREIPIERYHWPLGLGLLLLVLEWSIGNRKRSGPGFIRRIRGVTAPGQALPVVLAVLALAGVMMAPTRAGASPRQAERMYHSGNYADSIALWKKAIEAKPGDPRLHFNLGNAHYRQGDYAAAIAAYEEALARAGVGLQERIFYNLANAQYRLGLARQEENPALTGSLWEESLTNYDNSLALNPDAGDASRNRALVEREFTSRGARITVQPVPPAGGTTSPGGRFLPGTVLDLEAQAHPNWRFVSWQGAEVEEPESARSRLMVRENREVAALFVETRQLEVLSANPDQGTAGSSGSFDLGQEVPIEAEPADYFVFREWVSEALEVADPRARQTTVRLTRDGSVMATFAEAFRLEVLAEPDIAGNVGTGGFYEQYSDVPIQAEARDGFAWLEWSGDFPAEIADRTAAETRVSLNGDRTVTARFERIWSLVVLPDRDEAGTTTGGGNFPIGSVQAIEATPREGFSFRRWEGPGVHDPEEARTRVDVLSGAQTVIALFDQDEGDDENENSSNEESEPDEGEGNPEGDSDDRDDSSPEDAPSEGDENTGSEPEPRDGEGDAVPEEQENPRETPESLTEEEARHLLQILRQDERQLPLRILPSEEPPTTGRDW